MKELVSRLLLQSAIALVPVFGNQIPIGDFRARLLIPIHNLSPKRRRAVRRKRGFRV